MLVTVWVSASDLVWAILTWAVSSSVVRYRSWFGWRWPSWPAACGKASCAPESQSLPSSSNWYALGGWVGTVGKLSNSLVHRPLRRGLIFSERTHTCDLPVRSFGHNRLNVALASKRCMSPEAWSNAMAEVRTARWSSFTALESLQKPGCSEWLSKGTGPGRLGRRSLDSGACQVWSPARTLRFEAYGCLSSS